MILDGKKVAIFIFIVISLFRINNLYAEQPIKIYSSTDKSKIGINETLQLTVTVETDKTRKFSEPEISFFKDFEIISKNKSYSTSISIIDGRVKKTKKYIYKYTLKPKSIGKKLLGPITITYRGKKYSTEPIEIVVTKEKNENNYIYDEDLAINPEEIKKNIIIDAKITKNRIYVGEQAILTYTLLSKYEIEKISIIQNPDIKGLYVFEIKSKSTQLKGTMKYRNNFYRFFILKRLVIYPLYSGTFTIEPVTAKITVLLRNKQFQNIFALPFTLNVTSKNKLTLNVKTLPPYRGDIDFSGIVGKVDLTISQKEKTIQRGSSTIFYITLKSNGNLNNFTGFKPQSSIKSKIFATNTYNDMVISRDKIYFIKKYEFALIPEETGTLNISPVNIIYFNPETERYEERAVKGLSFKVFEPEKTSKNLHKDSYKEGNNKKNKVRNTFLIASLFLILLISIISMIKIFKKKPDQKIKDSKIQKNVDDYRTFKLIIASIENNIFLEKENEASDNLKRLILEFINIKLGTKKNRLSIKDIEKLDISSKSKELLKEIIENLYAIRYSIKGTKEVTIDQLNKDLSTIKSIIKEAIPDAKI